MMKYFCELNYSISRCNIIKIFLTIGFELKFKRKEMSDLDYIMLLVHYITSEWDYRIFSVYSAFNTKDQTISLLLRILCIALPSSYLSMLTQSHVVPPPHAKALLTKNDFLKRWRHLFIYLRTKNEEKHNIFRPSQKQVCTPR